jgi:hypothetical protein
MYHAWGEVAGIQGLEGKGSRKEELPRWEAKVENCPCALDPYILESALERERRVDVTLFSPGYTASYSTIQ